MVDFHNVKEHGATFTHETLLDLMKNLNIQTKLAGIVGDSTISMVQTMEKTAFSSNSFPHVCFLHVFQLCIRVALSDSDNDPVYKALSALKKRVNYMRNSCKFVYFAQEKAKSENVPFIMPKKENLTRWDSTFFMIESVVTQLGFLDACLTEFAQQEKSNSNIPSAIGDRHGYTLFELYKTLSMFRNVTIEGQRTDRSIGSLIPMYHYVEKCCFIAQDHTDEFIRKIGRTVLVEFDFRVNQHYKRDEKWKTEYIIAAFLDKSNNQFLKKLDAHGTMKQTFIDCVNITASYQPARRRHVQNLPRKYPKLSFDSMVKSVFDSSELEVYTTNQNTSDEISELSAFLADDSNEKLNNLEWWALKKNDYPFLLKYALRLLTIPISSAGIERGFSHARHVLKDRTQLLEFKRKELLILKINSCSTSG